MQNYDECGCCPVCKNHMQNFGLSACKHTICGTCAIRLRVICKDKRCSTCRAEISRQIIATKNYNFADLDISLLIHDADSDLWFENQKMKHFHDSLLICRCPVNVCGLEFRNMSALNRHCSIEHRLMYCDLCLANLNHFPREFECYTERNLINHRNWSSSNLAGHPMCEFCQKRFFDSDALFKHMNTSHIVCQICLNANAATANPDRPYYRDLNELMIHCRQCHYVCEEGHCENAQLTNIFASEADLKHHKLTEHTLSRSEQRETRQLTIPLHFTRELVRGRGRGSRHHGQHALGNNEQLTDELSDEMTEDAGNTASYQMNPEDYPSLTGQVMTTSAPVVASKPVVSTAVLSHSHYVSDYEIEAEANRNNCRSDSELVNAVVVTTTNGATTAPFGTTFSFVTVRPQGSLNPAEFPALGAPASTGRFPAPLWNSNVARGAANSSSKLFKSSLTQSSNPQKHVKSVNNDVGYPTSVREMPDPFREDFPTLPSDDYSIRNANWVTASLPVYNASPNVVLVKPAAPTVTQTTSAHFTASALGNTNDFPSLSGGKTPVVQADWPRKPKPNAMVTPSSSVAMQGKNKLTGGGVKSQVSSVPATITTKSGSDKVTTTNTNVTQSQSFSNQKKAAKQFSSDISTSTAQIPVNHKEELHTGLSLSSRFDLMTEVEVPDIPESSRFVPHDLRLNTTKNNSRNHDKAIDVLNVENFPSLTPMTIPISLNNNETTHSGKKNKKKNKVKATSSAMVQQSDEINHIATVNSNGLKIENEVEIAPSLGEPPVSVFTMADLVASLSPERNYAEVADYEARNEALFVTLKEMYADGFDEFVELSLSYRNHSISAKEYMSSIHKLLITKIRENKCTLSSSAMNTASCKKSSVEQGALDMMGKVVGEMIILLPDIALQKNLMKELLKEEWKKNLKSCYYCDQIIDAVKDVQHHLAVCSVKGQ